ncbi:MAG: hypothetical protein JNK78_17155 [Planctomycetes bacterium]|nr:hypothetical protein [Planctomycetota bacterium]
MHTTNLLTAVAALAALGWLCAPQASDAANAPPAALPGAPTQPTQPTQPPPVARGHLTLVVEGDRDQLTIRRAVAKEDPWAGVPKGLTSAWTLTIRAQDGSTLAEIPLDLVHFDTAADRKGAAVRVEGCVVRDSRIAMLVNVPRFAEAATYQFSRRDGVEDVPVGFTTGARVNELAGGGR